MDTQWLIWIGGAVIAMAIGVLTGLFGVGGGFLLTPALMILLHVPAATAVGTGLTVIMVTSVTGLLKRRGTGTVDLRLAVAAGSGSLLGVFAGQRLMQHFTRLPPLVFFGRSHAALEYILLWAYLILLGWIALQIYSDYRKMRLPQPPTRRIGLWAGFRVGPYGHFTSLEHPRFSLTALVGMGIGIGWLTGLMGIGGGVLWLPVLIYLVGQRMQQAVGTSLLLVWIAALGGSALNVAHGNISWPLGLAMLLGGSLGTWHGTHFSLKTSGAKLRLYFIFVLIAALVLIGIKLYAATFV